MLDPSSPRQPPERWGRDGAVPTRFSAMAAARCSKTGIACRTPGPSVDWMWKLIWNDGQAAIFESALEHEAHRFGRQGSGRELFLFAQDRAEQRGFLRIHLDAGHREILFMPAVKVMADGGLALRSTLFPESQNPLGSPVLKVPAPQSGSLSLHLTASDLGLILG